MRTFGSIACLVLVAALPFAKATTAQEKPKAPAQAAVPSMPALPQLGPEQAILKNDVGVWDATVEIPMEPGAPPSVTKGVETNTLGCGGLCLIGDFKGEMMGQPFSGHNVAAYDTVKKKYVSTWMDSMSLGPSLSEATFDASKKVMTGVMEGPDMSGRVTKMRTVAEWKDPATRVLTMYTTGPDGKEVVGLRITYKRR